MTVITEHPNVLRMREGTEAFAKGDFEVLRGLFEPDILWVTAGPRPGFKGEYRGVDEALGYFTELFTQTDGTLKFELEQAFADETIGVAINHVTGDRKGQHLDSKIVMVYEFHGDRAFRATEYLPNPELFMTFWA